MYERQQERYLSQILALVTQNIIQPLVVVGKHLDGPRGPSFVRYSVVYVLRLTDVSFLNGRVKMIEG